MGENLTKIVKVKIIIVQGFPKYSKIADLAT